VLGRQPAVRHPGVGIVGRMRVARSRVGGARQVPGCRIALGFPPCTDMPKIGIRLAKGEVVRGGAAESRYGAAVGSEVEAG